MSSRSPTPCEMPGYCFDNFLQPRILCPSATDSFPGTLGVAENLCPRVMKSVHELSEDETTSAMYRNAWAAVELGLSHGQAEPEIAQSHIARATGQLETLIGKAKFENRPYKPSPITDLMARSLIAFMPAFEARIEPQNTFDELGCQAVYRGLVSALAVVANLPKNKQAEINGHIVEVEVMALAARIGDPSILAYPASPREEAQGSGQKQYNHDICVLRPGEHVLRKMPIQVKYSKGGKDGYHPGIERLYYKEDILVPAGAHGRRNLGDLMVADVNETIKLSDKNILDNATLAASGFIEVRLHAEPKELE